MAIITNNPTANDPASWFETIWSALHHWKQSGFQDEITDEDWNKVTEAMAWITEELGYELDENGDYVPA